MVFLDEHSRVKLTELSGDLISSYINANYIHGWPNEARAFIATQGPLANTIIDFYRMIWEEYVPVIVMITRLFENNKVRKIVWIFLLEIHFFIRQNVKAIFRIYKVINMDHFLFKLNQQSIKMIMKYEDSL